MSSNLENKGKILLLWGPPLKQEHLVETVDNLKKTVGSDKLIAVENLDRLIVSDHASSSFDIVYCGTQHASIAFHPVEIFSEIARILKPGGTVVVRETVIDEGEISNLRTASKLASTLKLSGFIDVSQPKTVPITKTICEDYDEHFPPEKNFSLIEVIAKKPSFEVGSSVSLFQTKKVGSSKSDASAAKVWMLSSDDTLDENVELINEDDLLDDNDLKKPDPLSLKVCATTKQRKACKNCSCGLAEELENEAAAKIEKNKSASSACGNCYLGDAFRCASCPYLGMPAFKPGEKILLTDNQLKADV